MAYPRDINLKTQFPNTDTREMHRVMECMSICRTCAKKCIEEGYKQLALLCLDCSDICDLTIKLKSSDSEYSQQVLELCAYSCRHCANECNRMSCQHCQECAEVCRRCAEACSLLTTYH